MNLEQKDGKLTSPIKTLGKKAPSKISRAEEEDKMVTIYFNSGSYNVYLVMEKKDEDNITGGMMDMFDATGKRIKTAEENNN